MKMVSLSKAIAEAWLRARTNYRQEKWLVEKLTRGRSIIKLYLWLKLYGWEAGRVIRGDFPVGIGSARIATRYLHEAFKISQGPSCLSNSL